MWTEAAGRWRLHAIGSSRILADWYRCLSAYSPVLVGLAAAGDTAALRTLWARGLFAANPSLALIAAGGDHLETVEWLVEHGVSFDAELFSAAAAGGATTVLQRLWDDLSCVRKEAALEEGCDRAIVGNVLDGALTRATEDTRALAWLVRQPGVDLGDTTALPARAAAVGNLGALRFLHESAGVAIADLTAARAAAAGGHLGVLAYLRKVGPPFDESVAEFAVAAREPAVRDATRRATESWLAEEAGCVTRWVRERREKVEAKKRAPATGAGLSSKWKWLSAVCSAETPMKRPLLPAPRVV